MKPVVDRLQKEYAGKVAVKVLMTDSGGAEMEQLASTFGVQYVPTFVFVDSKGTKTDTVVGETPEDTMRSKLDALK